jgi:hypothetical protein
VHTIGGREFRRGDRFPPASKCTARRVPIAKDKAAIRKLAAIASAKQAIPWVRVYRLADFVFFDHRYRPMNQAQCQDCHGPVEEQDAVTDSAGAARMVFCRSCHVKTHASAGCITCHNPKNGG